MRLFILLFTLVPMIFLGTGAYMAWSQHQKITTYQPVTATVLSGRVEEHTSTDSDGHRTTTYKPVINYRYEVRGRSYTCETVTPLDANQSGSWAREVVDQHKVGQACEAYYNPADPGEAFLIREYEFMPYIFTLFPIPFLGVAAGVYFSLGASQKKPPDPVPAGEGWYDIQPTSRIVDRRRAAVIVAVAWHIAGMVACGHYYVVAPPPHEMMGIVFTVTYSGLGAIPLAVAGYFHILSTQFSDAKVSVNAPQFRLGDQLAVYAEQSVHMPLEILETSVGLVCEETTKTRRGSKTTISNHSVYEKRIPALDEHTASPGDTLVAEVSLPIPQDKPPSTPAGEKGYPRRVWRVELVTKVNGKPDYRAKFPITVQGTSAADAPV